MDTNISRCIELPEALDTALAHFLDSRPEWDQNRAMQAAVSLFLMQQESGGRDTRILLGTMFMEAVAA
jgi:hypothetical protein